MCVFRSVPATSSGACWATGRAYDKGALENAIEMLVDNSDVPLGAVHATGEALRALFGPRMGGNQVAWIVSAL